MRRSLRRLVASRSPSQAPTGVESSTSNLTKAALILTLKTTETTVDDLPISGVKPAVSRLIVVIERVDVSVVILMLFRPHSFSLETRLPRKTRNYSRA